MIVFVARPTNSPPLPVTHSHEFAGAASWSWKCGMTYWANSSKLRFVRRTRPVVAEQQEGPETAGLVDELLDLADGVVGCADDGEPVFVDVVDDLLRVVAEPDRAGGQHVVK